MGSIYVLIAGLLLYFLAVRMVALSRMGAATASSMTVIGYFALGTLVNAINLSIYSIPLSQLFRPSQLIAVALQFIVVYAVFRKIQIDDDSYVAPLVWGAVGCIGVFFVIPSVVKLIGMKL